MGSAGRSHPARHPRAPGCAPVRRGRAGGPASGQPPGGVPAPQGAEGDRPRRRRGGRDPAHLPAQPRRRAGAAGPTGHVLEPGPGGLRSRDRRLHGGRDMTQAADTVVRKEIVVAAPIERAFSVFTDRFGDFKPPEHNLLAAPIAETIFEPRVGGHIYDRAEDGSECRWARILAYEPPTRVVFSWDIGPTWRSRPIPPTRARSRCASSPTGRPAPGSSSSTATSTATARAGRPSTTASTATPAGPSISPGTPPSSAPRVSRPWPSSTRRWPPR